jgi:hypothetical protein
MNPNNTERLFTDEELAYLPIGFQFFVKPPEMENCDPIEYQEEQKFVKIHHYQTDKYMTHSYYKPLSKIITQNNDTK